MEREEVVFFVFFFGFLLLFLGGGGGGVIEIGVIMYVDVLGWIIASTFVLFIPTLAE